MKKVVFTTILFIVLGTVWTLYLEYSNKRFVDSLPKTPATVTQPANTSDTPAAIYENSQAVLVDSVSAEPIAENAPVANRHTETLLSPQADTPETRHPPTNAPAQSKPAQTTSNPVPPEVIEDSERDLEWWRATKKWEEKYWAFDEEQEKLSQEHNELTPSDQAGLDALMRKIKEDPSYADEVVAKLNAWEAKMKARKKKKEALEKEKPVRPTPTHTH